jgi:hypothetical protein
MDTAELKSGLELVEKKADQRGHVDGSKNHLCSNQQESGIA